jgi:hypothetical protein
MKFQNDFFCFCLFWGLPKQRTILTSTPQFIMGVLAEAKNGEKTFWNIWGGRPKGVSNSTLL